MEQNFSVKSIQTLCEIEEFDYTEYDSATLQNVINERKYNLSDALSTVRRLDKKLTSRRGYSNKQLYAMEFHLKGARRMVDFINTEIAECAAEIMRKNNVEELTK